jgi:hypothetical protein
VALMDSTRFSLDLTHMGSGQLRIKGQPNVRLGEQSPSVLNVNDLPLTDYDWTKIPQELWPVKILVNEPETAVFSGLSRLDAASAFPVASSGQRNAFEGRALAGGWEIDMSARENQVVPGSLADLLITFSVSGYHDPGLRAAIDAAKSKTTALTSFLSARQIFPDAFYDFSRTGRMVWKVPREMLGLNGDLGRLRNIGMSLRPSAPDVHFSRLVTRLRVKNPDLTVGVSPQFKLRLSRILLALVFDVALDHRLIHAHRRHKVPVGPNAIGSPIHLTQERKLLFQPLARVRFNDPHRLTDCHLRWDHHQQVQMILIVLHLHELQLWVVLANLSQAVTHIRLDSRIENLPSIPRYQHQVILTVVHTMMLLAVFHPPTIASQEDSGSSSSPTSRSGFYPQIKRAERAGFEPAVRG